MTKRKIFKNRYDCLSRLDFPDTNMELYHLNREFNFTSFSGDYFHEFASSIGCDLTKITEIDRTKSPPIDKTSMWLKRKSDGEEFILRASDVEKIGHKTYRLSFNKENWMVLCYILGIDSNNVDMSKGYWN